MQLDFWQVLTNLVGLFLLIAVGYGAVKLNIIPAEISGALSRLLLKITLPCTIFTSLLRPYDPSFLRDVIVVFVLGLVMLPIQAAIARPAAALLRVRRDRRGMWAFCTTFCNNGFMGFPIALALFGEEGLALAAVFNMSFNLIIYSMGAAMICSDRPKGAGGPSIDLRSVLVTGINVSAVLGLVFYFAQLSVPAAVLTPLTHLANVTTPLSMIITGMNLAGGSLLALFRDRDVLTAAAVRLTAMPLIAFALLNLFDRLVPFGNPLILGVIFVTLAMPTAAASTILAENYGINREFAASAVFLSSLFCIVTIPVMVMLL